MARKNKPPKRITSGGVTTPGVDIILSAPELFYFDINKYISSIKAAQGIDFSRRSRLYDMYESASLDLHLDGVIDKRLRGVTRLPIEFQRDGEPDEEINRQLASPWMKELRQDIILSKFWGFSLLQFYLDEEGRIRYDLIPRKHYDPIHRIILHQQNDTSGTPIEEYENMVFVGKERSLGMLSVLMTAVLYKRNNIGDWAKFCEIFGIPIRKYTYNAGDEETRKRLLKDATTQGVGAVYITPAESGLELIEAGNKSGSSELYEKFTDYWDRAISIRVLGNTLTTDASSTGTQALGTVHKEVEDEMTEDDCSTILDTLNYYILPVFANLGFNVAGGEFVYAKREEVAPQERADLYLKAKQLGLPLDDDEIYETLGIRKPQDYDAQRSAQEAMRQALSESLEGKEAKKKEKDEEEEEAKKPEEKERKGIKDSLSRFFGLALGEKFHGGNDF